MDPIPALPVAEIQPTLPIWQPPQTQQQPPNVTNSRMKRAISLNTVSRPLATDVETMMMEPADPVPSGRQLYNSRRFHYKHSSGGSSRQNFSGSTQSLHQSISRDSPSPPPSRFSDRSLSPDILLDGVDIDSYRRRNKIERRHYESDYEDQRFSVSSSSSGRQHRQSYRTSSTTRESKRTTSAALENRRRLFEREQEGGRPADRRWDPTAYLSGPTGTQDYSDSYSDVEFSKRRPPSRPSRQRNQERVSQYRRYFQEVANNEDYGPSGKTGFRRQSSQASSTDSTYARRYGGGQFDVYRSRFEVSHCVFAPFYTVE